MTKPTPGSAVRRAPGVLASIGAVAVGLAITSARPAQAAGDQVLIWNDQTTRAIEETAADPFQASRVLALESIAVLDTAKSIAGAPAFLVRLPGSRDLKADIAVAAAAHEMLNHLFPARRGVQDALLNASLSDQPAGPARDRALAFGKAVADAVFARREGDGWSVRGSVAPAQWRATPVGLLPPLNPRWEFITPFALLRPNQFRSPASGSEAMASLSTAQLIEPTAAQTGTARGWSDSAGASGPTGHWNAIASSILGPSGVGLEAEAELFAALNVAMADAGVAIVDAKSNYRMSRPVTGIQQVATGAPINQPGDMAGHSGFSGAAATVLTARLGAREFNCTSATDPGVTRTFESFQQAAEEAAASRVSSGIHTSFDNEDGLATGRAVGTWTLAAFRRLAEDRGPIIIMDAPAPAGSQTRAPSGYALDNYAPVKTVNVRVNGGERFNVAIDERGRFTLPRLHPGQFGQTDVMLVAISPTGRIATARLTIDGNTVDSVVTIPLSVQ